ncbi:hypothetical protein H6X68_12240, partial [Actinomyces sp. 186855]|nr:hypothetical protein [Actinomyces sp. 186855]
AEAALALIAETVTDYEGEELEALLADLEADPEADPETDPETDEDTEPR